MFRLRVSERNNVIERRNHNHVRKLTINLLVLYTMIKTITDDYSSCKTLI